MRAASSTTVLISRSRGCIGWRRLKASNCPVSAEARSVAATMS